MVKALPPVPVISELNAAQSQLLRNYLDELATRGIDVAPAEAKRLSPYLAALSDQLAEDIRASRQEDARQKVVTRLQEDFGITGVNYDESNFVDETHLKKIFNTIAKVTKNVILSELVIVPSDALQTGKRAGLMGEGTQIFSGEVKHAGLGYTLGFMQVKKDNGSVSVPVFAFDYELMQRALPYNPQVMLRAFQRVMTAGNHDMQHHYTNDILNPAIASTEKTQSMITDVSVKDWSNDYFAANFGGDTDPGSYESWLMLNHASIRARMDAGAQGDALLAAQAQFFDELARIVTADEKTNGAESAHQLLDYFAMGMMFALSRYRGITHPQLQDALRRMEEIDPLPSEITRNYIGGNTTPQPEGTSTYGHARLQQMQDMAPWALKLMEPALYNNVNFKAAYDRRGEINAGMIVSAASSASYFGEDGVYSFHSGGVDCIATMRDGKLQSIDGKPSFLQLSDDSKESVRDWHEKGIRTRRFITQSSGTTIEIHYDENGEQHCDDAPAEVTHFADGSVEQKWRHHGLFHRESEPAYFYMNSTRTERKWFLDGIVQAELTEYEDGRREQKWYADGKLHREDGPASISVNDKGELSEVHYRHGVMHCNDGPALIRNKADGAREESWLCEGAYHREDGPAKTEIRADGSRLEKWYLHDVQMRKDGLANEVETLADGTRIERWKAKWNGLHSEDMPAQITTYPDGTRKEEWFCHSQLHNAAGPAVVMIHADGRREEEWYNRGRKIDAPEAAPAIKDMDVAAALTASGGWKAQIEEEKKAMFTRDLRDKIRVRLDSMPPRARPS